MLNVLYFIRLVNQYHLRLGVRLKIQAESATAVIKVETHPFLRHIYVQKTDCAHQLLFQGSAQALIQYYKVFVKCKIKERHFLFQDAQQLEII